MNSSQKLGAVVRLLFALLAFSVALGLLFKAAPPVGALQPQSDEKSLDINRYPNEPLELVDLKIGENSVTERIRPKIKNNNSRLGMDNVKFKEKNDWFKNVKVRLRNVSGRPIYGLDVSLLFRPLNLEVGFRVSVKESQTKNLKSHPLAPGEEIDLGVDNHSLKLMLDQMLQNGVDANQSTLGLSVDGASFGDDFGWRKGSLMRRNPADPKKWDVVDKPEPSPTPSEASRLFQPAGFKTIGIKSLSKPMQQDPRRCTDHYAGFEAWACNGNQNDSCDTIRELGDGIGYYSEFRVFDLCIYRPGPLAEYCETFTFNTLLEPDVTCPPPGSTPTPPSCLPDGYVYYGDTPCCSGHSNGGLCGPAPSPTPPELTCWPNGYYDFGITPCCSGYSVNGICTANPGPTPMTCLPNGYLYFGVTPCCSGNVSPEGNCVANPPASPTPWLCTPNGFYHFTTPCCSGYSNADGICAPQPTGGGDPGGGGGGGGDGWCYWGDCSCSDDWECDTFCDWDGYCGWSWLDPIVIDVKGDGFAMTDAANGVTFDFFGRGVRRRLSWTAAGADDAWLVLDRNRNGKIDNAGEMFSNVSAQPTPPAGVLRIGFAALAEFDKAGNGGNGDSVIDMNDQVFTYLRLWEDANHNGISESSELHSLPELGLESMLLDYKESRRTDRWGNTFRYRAKVYGTNHKDLGRWAYDVILFSSQPAPVRATIDFQDAGKLPLWKIGVFRPSGSQALGQIRDVPEGKSFLREIASASSLLW